jgi:hypothetical protein
MFPGLTDNSIIWKKRKMANSEPIDFQSVGGILGRIPQIVEIALTFLELKCICLYDIIFMKPIPVAYFFNFH